MPSKTTLVSRIHRRLRTGCEHGPHPIVPEQERNAGRGDPYRRDARLRLIFANGCEVRQEFPD